MNSVRARLEHPLNKTRTESISTML
jgi:hypothetical protein